MNGLQELPANQVALAQTLKAMSKRSKKTLRQHIEDAEAAMFELRERGFRIVPFPPLKSLKKTKKVGRRATA